MSESESTEKRERPVPIPQSELVLIVISHKNKVRFGKVHLHNIRSDFEKLKTQVFEVLEDFDTHLSNLEHIFNSPSSDEE